jgi:hypothetical protein
MLTQLTEFVRHFNTAWGNSSVMLAENFKFTAFTFTTVLYFSSVAVAQSVDRLGYVLDNWSSIPSRGNEGIVFLFVTLSRSALGPTQPPIQWVVGALTPEVK